MGLQVSQRISKIGTTVSIGSAPYPMKNLDIAYPDHVWCGDISYIILADDSIAYLAILMDIYTRMIRGWSLRRDLSESLIQEALSKALQTGHVPAIHHSDQGVLFFRYSAEREQYKANSYDSRLLELDFNISMSRVGNPYDNAFAESFIKTLKT